MLAGERWFSNAAELDLKVIKCINYTHTGKYELPVPPSPNLKTMAAVYAYPSLCLFEGTLVSVGRGTSMPFMQYGCPAFEGQYSYSFTPQGMEGAKNPPYEHKACYGELIGADAEAVQKRVDSRFQPGWIINAYKAHPDKEKFFTPFFTKLAGTTALAKQIRNGDSEEMIKASWKNELQRFKKIRKKYLLYKDFE